MEENIICAIDLGTNNLGVSIGNVKDGEIEIIGSEQINSQGIEKGIIRDFNLCSNQVETILELVEKRYKVDIDKLYVGISNIGMRVIESWGSVNLKDGKVKISDIKRAINKGRRNAIIDSDDEVIDEIVNYYKLDGNVTSQSVNGWIGSTLEINLTLVIVKKEVMDSYRKLFDGTKYVISKYMSNSICSRNIFLSDKTSMGTRTLIDCGAGVTDIVIFKNGVAKYVDAIRLGGNNITKDLSICAEIPVSEAEKIKRFASESSMVSLENEEKDRIVIGTTEIDIKLFRDVSRARIEEIINYIDEALKKCSHFDEICSIIIYGEALSYFENINNIVKAYINKKIQVITKERLGISSHEKISSLGLLKEALDREILFKEESTDLHKSTMVNDEIKINEEVEGQSIVMKIKGFLHEIF